MLEADFETVFRDRRVRVTLQAAPGDAPGQVIVTAAFRDPAGRPVEFTDVTREELSALCRQAAALKAPAAAEEYLGDGLYVRVEPDTGAVWLRAPRDGGDHEVALEPEVLQAFLAWLRRSGMLS